MKRFMTIVALTCVLCAPTMAGEIPSGGIAPPPPNGATPTTTSTSPGDVPTVGVAEQLSSDVLSALLAVLGFLAVR